VKTIDEQVFDGIRKTINRFREKPFHYFTEADIHSSLLNDIMKGGSDVLSVRKNNISISLIHQEYPTHFRYKKEQLLEGYKGIEDKTTIDKKYGDRGNYDLSILDPAFVNKMFAEKIEPIKEKNKKFKLLPLKHIINKDIHFTKDHACEELLYAIEVKFLHIFNARNSDMLKEVIKDNKKLRLTHIHSKGNTKCINLVFCSSKEGDRKVKEQTEQESVPNRIKEYMKGKKEIKLYNSKIEMPSPYDHILNIFIESYIDDKLKKTKKPTTNENENNLIWAKDLIKLL